MNSHTPGPWDYDKDSKEIFSCDEGHGCGWIALVGGNDSNGRRLPDEMRSANCSLIAAAPELLEVLKTMVDPAMKPKHLMREEWERLPWIVAARAAISKATGNPQAENAR